MAIDYSEVIGDFLAGMIARTNGGIAIGDPRRDYYVNSFYVMARTTGKFHLAST